MGCDSSDNLNHRAIEREILIVQVDNTVECSAVKNGHAGARARGERILGEIGGNGRTIDAEGSGMADTLSETEEHCGGGEECESKLNRFHRAVVHRINNPVNDVLVTIL